MGGERTVKRLFRHEKALRGFAWAEQQLEERGNYIIVIPGSSRSDALP